MRITESQLKKLIRGVLVEQSGDAAYERAFKEGFPKSGFSDPRYAGLKKHLGTKKYKEYFIEPRDVTQSWTCAYAPKDHPVWEHIPDLAKSYEALVDAFNSDGPDSPTFMSHEKKHQALVSAFKPDLQDAIRADKEERRASQERYDKSMKGVRLLGDDPDYRKELPASDVGGPLWTTRQHKHDPYSGYHGSTSRVQNRAMTRDEYDNYIRSGGR